MCGCAMGMWNKWLATETARLRKLHVSHFVRDFLRSGCCSALCVRNCSNAFGGVSRRFLTNSKCTNQHVKHLSIWNTRQRRGHGFDTRNMCVHILEHAAQIRKNDVNMMIFIFYIYNLAPIANNANTHTPSHICRVVRGNSCGFKRNRRSFHKHERKKWLQNARATQNIERHKIRAHLCLHFCAHIRLINTRSQLQNITRRLICRMKIHWKTYLCKMASGKTLRTMVIACRKTNSLTWARKQCRSNAQVILNILSIYCDRLLAQRKYQHQ